MVLFQKWQVCLFTRYQMSSAHLCCEASSFLWWVILAISRNVPTTDILNGDVFHIKSDVITWQCLRQGLMMHLYRFNLSGHVHRSKCHDHAGFQDAGLNTTDWDCTDTCESTETLDFQNSLNAALGYLVSFAVKLVAAIFTWMTKHVSAVWADICVTSPPIL